MNLSAVHIFLLAGAVIAGLLGSATGLISVCLYTPQDVFDNIASGPAEQVTAIDRPTWYVALVLIVGTGLSLSILHESHSVLDYLSLYLVFFALLAIALMDLEWQMIGLDLFVPLALGSIGWVLLHPITIWLAVITTSFTLFGLALWLTHARRNHGDLLLAIFVGLFCGAGAATPWESLAIADRLAIGICVGALAMLVHGLARRLANPDSAPFWNQTGALGPVFLCGTLFAVFLH